VRVSNPRPNECVWYIIPHHPPESASKKCPLRAEGFPHCPCRKEDGGKHVKGMAKVHYLHLMRTVWRHLYDEQTVHVADLLSHHYSKEVLDVLRELKAFGLFYPPSKIRIPFLCSMSDILPFASCEQAQAF